MSFVNRKNILSEVKTSIQNELDVKLFDLITKRNNLEKTIENLTAQDTEVPKGIKNDLRDLNVAVQATTNELSVWQSSKRIKKKKQIEWKSEKERQSTRSNRPKKEINWAEAGKVSVKNKSLTKNNLNWLSEGSLVVHKDDRGHFLMVITIDDDGVTTLLDDGIVRRVRTLSLRPALDE